MLLFFYSQWFVELALALALWSAYSETNLPAKMVSFGELSLAGEVRPVNRIEQRIAEAEKLGFSDMIIPKYNMQGIDAKKYHINLHPVRKVEEALRLLFG